MVSPSHGRFETRYSARGYPMQVWVSDMPRISDELLDCVVYLYPSEAEAEDGLRIGGTGFLVGVPLGGTKDNLILVVTNRHVIEGGSMTVRINTHDGAKDIVPLDQHEWILHPSGKDDLAACPIGLNSQHHKARYLSTNLFMTKEKIALLDIGPGDDAFVVGRFVSHEGKQKNVPSVRFGNIAQMPWEPIVVDGFPQESFLVEIRSIAGYSGAPVFVYILPQPVPPSGFSDKFKDMLPFYNKKREPFQAIGQGPFLLGVDYCHLFDRQPVMDESTQRNVNNDWRVRANTGMMGVIPAWKLMELIDGPKMKKIRDADEP